MKILLSLLIYTHATAFFSKLTRHNNYISSPFKSNLHMKSKDDKLGGNLISQALFGVSEIFGTLTNTNRELPFLQNNEINNLKSKKVKKEIYTVFEMQELIKSEYEKIFWATGNMDTSLWESNCTFADPFSSFGGENSVERFKTNANNLASGNTKHYLNNKTRRIERYEESWNSKPIDVIKRLFVPT